MDYEESKRVVTITVDDEKPALERMSYLFEQCELIDNKEYLDDPDQVLDAVSRHNPDLIFLDIEMPRKSGFEVVSDIRDSGFNPYFVFVTAYNQYAIKAIKTKAFDFLLKPVDIDELKSTISSYLEYAANRSKDPYDIPFSNSLRTENSRIRFNTRTGYVIIKPEEIIYCEANGAYTSLIMITNKKVVTSTYLSDVEKHLPPDKFLRVSRSLLINSEYLTEFKRAKRLCILSDGEQEIPLQVSKRYLGALKDF